KTKSSPSGTDRTTAARWRRPRARKRALRSASGIERWDGRAATLRVTGIDIPPQRGVKRLMQDSGGLTALTLKQASEQIRSKKVSPVELTEACLDRIKTYNPKINAWIT